MNVFIKSFGCKLNRYESESILSELITRGHTNTDEADADCIIINSCTVTEKSDAKLRKYIRAISKIEPAPLVILSGCYAAVHSCDTLGDIVVVKEKHAVADRVDELLGTNSTHDSAVAQSTIFPIRNTTSTTSRAFVKIQDGCDFFCNYCIVAHARGSLTSASFDDLRDTAKRLEEEGFREIVLSGVNLGAYNDNGRQIEDLAEALLRDTTSMRIRFSSLEPVFLNDARIALFSEARIAGHAHIPLQSGSDEVLVRMKRRYDAKTFLERIERLRDARANLALTTDVMVGHPGETEKAFEETRRVLATAAVMKMHVFRYSKRNGTPSATMKDQIPERVKTARARILIKQSEEQHESFRASMLGHMSDVVIERTIAGGYEGIGGDYLRYTIETTKRLKKRSIEHGRFIRIAGEKNILAID